VLRPCGLGAGGAQRCRRPQHAWLAWTLAAAGCPGLAVHAALLWLGGWPLALLWTIAVLYGCLGFRQFSHHFTPSATRWSWATSARSCWPLAAGGRAAMPRSELVRL
jgi:adenosylcobinamide-phosphate synthase